MSSVLKPLTPPRSPYIRGEPKNLPLNVREIKGVKFSVLNLTKKI
jgi:hypothetical protein